MQQIFIIKNAACPRLTQLIPYINQPSMHRKCTDHSVTQIFIIHVLFPCNTHIKLPNFISLWLISTYHTNERELAVYASILTISTSVDARTLKPLSKLKHRSLSLSPLTKTFSVTLKYHSDSRCTLMLSPLITAERHLSNGTVIFRSACCRIRKIKAFLVFFAF